MTRETKVGLLVGMGVILLIGIIISDHLSEVNKQNPADEAFTEFARHAQESINPQVAADDRPASTASARRERSVLQRVQPLPTPQELAPAQRWQAEDVSAPPAPRELPRAYQLGSQPLASTNTEPLRPVQPDFAPVPTLTFSHEQPEEPQAEPQRLAGAFDNAHAPSVLQRRTMVDAEPETRIQPAADRAARGEIIHYVKPGETLYHIAQRYYGDGEYWRTLADYNRGSVRPDGGVGVNVRLLIPNKAGLAAVSPDFIPVTSDAPRATGTAPAARNAPAAPARTIRVDAGDTLSRLAEQHLGSSSRWRDLLDANRDQLDRPEALRAGMELKLPTAGGEASSTQRPAAAPAVAAAANSSTPTEYTVQPGDNLSRIAAKTLGDASRFKEIFEANRSILKSPDALVVGQKLRIPR